MVLGSAASSLLAEQVIVDVNRFLRHATMIRPTVTTMANSALGVEAAPQMIEKIIAVTRNLFPGEVTFQPEFDPDAPQHRFLVFTVSVRGEAQEVVDRRCQWHRQVQQLRPAFDYRLSIEP